MTKNDSESDTAGAGGRLISAARWREMMASAPSPDEDFARDVEAARKDIGPPSNAWPS